MISVRRNKIAVLLALSFLFYASAAVADDEAFYESLPDVAIGKVFFSPLQRARLDQRRGGGAGPRVAATNSANVARKKLNKDAAGFIVSSKGESKVYTNGEFVAVRPGDSVDFPGTVKIVRGEKSNKSEAGDATD